MCDLEIHKAYRKMLMVYGIILGSCDSWLHMGFFPIQCIIESSMSFLCDVFIQILIYWSDQLVHLNKVSIGIGVTGKRAVSVEPVCTFSWF